MKARTAAVGLGTGATAIALGQLTTVAVSHHVGAGGSPWALLALLVPYAVGAGGICAMVWLDRADRRAAIALAQRAREAARAREEAAWLKVQEVLATQPHTRWAPGGLNGQTAVRRYPQ